ncbi:MAG TPA: hypothetical protein ENJ32_12945 [Crenotrichaceae bacterium]|nr:hypothetical protein [Crenotrichaceae bacterium]
MGGKQRDYVLSCITFISIALCLVLDANSTHAFQDLLGVFAWVFLAWLLAGECIHVRAQVVVAIIFATIGEHFASPYMGGYIYRFHNVPAYIPPGHGMVYLTAVALARSDLFAKNAITVRNIVFTIMGAWSVWGVTIAGSYDWVGFLLFCVFVPFVLFGRSPLVYLGAFFVTTWLEIIGTAVGTWHWVPIDPVLGLPQGNPPSGVAAWYCLVDAVALGGAPLVMDYLNRVRLQLPEKWSNE